MKQKYFSEAIQIAGVASASAVGSIRDPGLQTPENMANIAASVFDAVFKQVVAAAENGRGTGEEISGEGEPD